MRPFAAVALATIMAVAIGCSTDSSRGKPDSASTPRALSDAAPAQADDPCKAPAQMSATPEETAWRLFVAAACPVNADRYPYLVWENWIEQSQLYNPAAQALGAPQPRRFHASPLRALMQAKRASQRAGQPLVTAKDLAAITPQDCGLAGSGSGRVICEETRINPDAQAYVVNNGLTKKAGQVAFASAGKPFVFTAPSVEIKADWVRLASCDAPPTDVHVEKVDGRCYALAGMHLISKLVDKWVWATFEPQNAMTNPKRCVELTCTDTWGSQPATTSGAPTQATAALAGLMTAAKLAPEWKNYRLDGVQIDFMNGQQPSLLGNSIIEGENVGAPLKTSSCITCHAFSTIRTDGKPAMSADFKVGNPLPLPPGMISRDFVWSLALAR